MDPKPPKAASFDPGWNDPPPLPFVNQIQAPPKPRTTLNKRVAFPVQANTSLPPVAPVMQYLPPILPDNQPPPSNDSPVIPVSLQNEGAFSQVSETCVRNEVLNSSEMCKIVIDSLTNILSSCTELGNKVKDLKKRVDIINNQWQKDQLSDEIQQKLYELVEALNNRNLSQANIIHQCLVVDHISSVASWIPAIRQIIHHLQVKEELLNIDVLEESNAT